MRKTILGILIIAIIGILYWNHRSLEGFVTASDGTVNETINSETSIAEQPSPSIQANQPVNTIDSLMRTALVSGKVNVSYDPALGFKERVLKRMEDIQNAKMGNADYEYSVPPELDDVYEEEMKALSKLL